MSQRLTEIGQRWAQIHERIAAAAQRGGRSASDLTTIAVTKTFPPSDIEHLIELGFRDIGENRVAELQQKTSQQYSEPIRWHMLGQLQTNKVNHAVATGAVIHSCDRPRLVNALARAGQNHGREVEVLIQVRLDADPKRGGVDAAAVGELADLIGASEPLKLRGVMAMAPLHGDPAPAFARLEAASQRLVADHPDATWISAGMSADFETAIEYGATHLRLGRGLLGSRPDLG